MLRMIQFVLLLLPVIACAGQHDRTSVFVSIPPQQQFVEKIGGDHVEVFVMLPPGQTPETWTPSPRMLAQLSKADLYFQIGVPFEASWTDAMRSANPSLRIAECCENFSKIKPESDAHEHEDLHIWSSPANVQRLAKLILDELTAFDPKHAQDYQDGYRKFISELKALDDSIRRQLQGRRIDQFIVSHAAWGEFAGAYGLVQRALENNGREIGPKALLEIVSFAREQNITTVFAIAQYRTPVTASLAKELGARVVELDPLAADYLGNMQFVTSRIAEALK